VFCVSDTPVYIGTSAIPPPPPYFIITDVVTVINRLLDLYLIGIYQLPTLLYFDNLIHDIIAVYVADQSPRVVVVRLAVVGSTERAATAQLPARMSVVVTLALSSLSFAFPSTPPSAWGSAIEWSATRARTYPANTDIIIIIVVVVITVVSPMIYWNYDA